MNIIDYLNKYERDVLQYKDTYETFDNWTFPSILITLISFFFFGLFGFFIGTLGILPLPVSILFLKYKKKNKYYSQLNNFLNQSTKEENIAYYHLRLLWELDCLKDYEQDDLKAIVKLLKKEPEKCKPKEWRLELMSEYFVKSKLEKYSNMDIETIKNKLISKLNKKMLKHINQVEHDYQQLSQFIKHDDNQLNDKEQTVFHLKKSISTAI